MFSQTQDKSLADKKRAILIKNAYLGLEKVENCHKVKSQRMKDQMRLQSLMRQYDRDKYIMSLNTYRSQQYLKSKLGYMIDKSEIDLVRASGDKKGLSKLLESSKERPFNNLAGPSAVEERLFQQVLDSRRDSLIDMRKPENYSKRTDKKGFWEEDEEFYKSFGGAIRNPFQMIDSLMEQSIDGGDNSQTLTSAHGPKPFSRRMKSLSAVEKMSFTKQRHFDVKSCSRRGKSAATSVDTHFKAVLESHEKTTQELRKDLDSRQKQLYLSVDTLISNKESKNDSKILAALEKYEKSQEQRPEKVTNILPQICVTLDPATMSIKSQGEWRQLLRTAHTPSLTWRPVSKSLNAF